MEWYLSVRQSVLLWHITAGFHAAVVYYCVEPHTHPLPIQNAANAGFHA